MGNQIKGSQDKEQEVSFSPLRLSVSLRRTSSEMDLRFLIRRKGAPKAAGAAGGSGREKRTVWCMRKGQAEVVGEGAGS